ncbi:hypothetical protein BER93_14690 [Xanthomonas fragariae]|nr:hypothetical protein BER92_14655 [Xanthomonas fragariae]AOD19132.1 hypothetical protein BER93_14690 [Xanthomonas fragariae]ENZ95288.1 hypothetical protein O1K_09287 [Xanthomonas fragariae LMG 25863]
MAPAAPAVCAGGFNRNAPSVRRKPSSHLVPPPESNAHAAGLASTVANSATAPGINTNTAR